MSDIQVGDIIEVYNEHYGEMGQYQILFIPTEPGQPWVVKEVEGEYRKWRLWTQGQIIKTFTRTS